MRLSSHGIGWVLALAGGAFVVAADLGVGQVIRPADEVVAIAADAADSIDVTGSVGIASGVRPLPLSLEQLAEIFDDIMQIRDVPEASVPDAATAMPVGVTLQDMPARVTSDIPMVQGYKFVKLDDRIVLVRPADRSVVAAMPRYKLIVD